MPAIRIIAFITLNALVLTVHSHPAKNMEVISTLYHTIDFTNIEKPQFDLFYHGLVGFYQLKDAQKLSDKKEILTLIDFRKSGNEKRLWVIDLTTKKVLFYSLVAHGRNSGEVYASKFSNLVNSYQSSLGFYVTGSIYIGKHGVSLKLYGMEEGINHLAEPRAIVMHGAEYVSESYIKKVGRLGRSHGCPAVPMDIHKKMIPELAEGTLLFIYYPDKTYLLKSNLLKNTAH